MPICALWPVSLALCGFCLERNEMRCGVSSAYRWFAIGSCFGHKPLERPMAPLVATASAGWLGEGSQYPKLTWASVLSLDVRCALLIHAA